MSEQNECLSPETLLQAVRDEQNKKEDGRREVFLANTFFHIHVHAEVSFDEIARLSSEFIEEKKGKSMDECFDMALSEKYFDKIHVVELGLTKNPSATGEIDGLKDEYRKFRERLIHTGIIEEDLSRKKSHRWFETQESQFSDVRKTLIRNRPLIETVIPDTSIRIGIAKRMIFSIPTPLYIAVARRFDCTEVDGEYPQLDSEEAMEYVEELMQKNDRKIDSIRTGYYLMTERVE